jgi:hypothetical protein
MAKGPNAYDKFVMRAILSAKEANITEVRSDTKNSADIQIIRAGACREPNNMKPALQKIRTSTKALFIFSFIATSLSAYSQENQNPAEKYTAVYKKYLNAACPIPKDSIRHFVYFAKDREALTGHPLLQHHMFRGAQIMYSWRDLEPQKDVYDFSIIKQDYEYLRQHGKKLFIQLQDASFNPKYKPVPEYLLDPQYAGGAIFQYNDEGKPEGWVAKRWNEKVRTRFALLLQALGKEFDGKVEGINLQETSVGVSPKTDPSFSEVGYINGLKANMLAMKKAFPRSTTMIYANFITGEFLPWTDKGYLRSIYQFGESIGVGLGNPDLMVTRKAQLNNPLAMMHEGKYSVPIGIAVQDGNYIGKTGADEDYKENGDTAKQVRNNIVPLLHAFAKDFLRVSYMFWVNQEPYFKEDVLPCFSRE